MDAEVYPQEVLADEEPKYLRRQKPLEIKRRKFGRKAWSTYLRVTMWAAAGIAGAVVAYECGHFLMASPEMALIHPDQVSIGGNHYVSDVSVRELFAADRAKSVLRIPLDERRRELEAMPWVEQATVRRELPNRIAVEIVERTPIAFLREANDLALVDAHGVILERPLAGDFHFPVVTGIGADTALDERDSRMQMFAGFLQQIESAQSGASDRVSEVNLSDTHDLRATLTGFESDDAGSAPTKADIPVLVHFGDGDFAGKYQTLVDEFAQWHAKAGRIESVDLRFSREAVVNQDTTAAAQQLASSRAASRPPKQSAARASKRSPE
jgi:cell division protein FtsQ